MVTGKLAAENYQASAYLNTDRAAFSVLNSRLPGVSDGAQIGFQPFAGHADADPSEGKLANKKPAGMSQAGLGAKCLLMKTEAASYFLATPPMRHLGTAIRGRCPW